MSARSKNSVSVASGMKLMSGPEKIKKKNK